MKRKTRKHPMKEPKRWHRDDNRNAGLHRDKRTKGSRKQEEDKAIAFNQEAFGDDWYEEDDDDYQE